MRFENSMDERKYIFPEYTTGEEIRYVRKLLKMSQREMAQLLKCSKPTIERWEGSRDKPLTGPVVVLMDILKREPYLLERFRLPADWLKLRLYYMFRDMICTVIDVDEAVRRVRIKNYTDNLLYRDFGKKTEPDFDDYESFIESRCFPRTRDKIKLELKRLGIPFYDPILIIEKTEGRMAKDLCINNLCILLVFFSAGLRQKASPYLGMATFSSLPAKKNPEQTAHVIFAQFLSELYRMVRQKQ